MQRMLLFIFFLFLAIIAVGQTRPDQFNRKFTPVDTDEIYSQEGGNPVRIVFSDAKEYFKNVNISGSVPSGTKYDVWIDTTGMDELYFRNGATWKLLEFDEPIFQVAKNDAEAAGLGVAIGERYRCDFGSTSCTANDIVIRYQ